MLAKGPTFAEIDGAPRTLKGWKVYVNGGERPNLCAAVTADGHLKLKVRKGFCAIVR